MAKDRLVVMVTHNPELADQYSNRIIKLLDGEVVSDTNAYSAEEEADIQPRKKKKYKTSYITISGIPFLRYSF